MDLPLFAAISARLSIDDVVARAAEAYVPMNQSPHPSESESSGSEAGSVAQSGAKSDPVARPYFHVRNANGGIDSFCQRCQAVIASSTDEWSLLACEERHVCVSQDNPMATRS